MKPSRAGRLGRGRLGVPGEERGGKDMSAFSVKRRLLKAAVLGAAVTVFSTIGVGQAFATAVVCGQVITQSTHVSNDLTNCPGDGLVIGASNIKLDLGGHTIDGLNTAGSDGINNKGGFDRVTVKHGTVQQFFNGLELLGADNNKLDHLTVTQNTLDAIRLTASNGNKVEHTTVHTNFDGIFLVNSDHNRVSHNKAYGNGSSGIVLQFGNDFNKVDHNVAHDNPAWGITSDGSTHDTYEHNKVYNNNIAGIEPFNGTNLDISKNNVFHNTTGIELFATDNSALSKNKIRSNTGDGIRTLSSSNGNQLLKNHSDKNGANGIDVLGPGNTITKNHANKNGNLGIFAAAGNIDGGGNKAHHNGNPAQCVGVSCS